MAQSKPQTKKRGRPSKKQAPKPEIDKTYSILIFAIGAVIGVMTYVDGSALWNKVCGWVVFGPFGWGAYAVAPLLIYIAILVAMGKPFKAKLLQASLFTTLFGSATVIFSKDGVLGEKLMEKLVYLYQQGAQGKAGGWINALFSVPLLELGKVVAGVIIVLLTLIFLMLLTSVTPYDIFLFIKNRVHGVGTAAKESIGAYPTEINAPRKAEHEGFFTKKKRKTIDIDLGPEPNDEHGDETGLDNTQTAADEQEDIRIGVATVPDFAHGKEKAEQNIQPNELNLPNDSLEPVTDVDNLIRKALGVKIEEANQPIISAQAAQPVMSVNANEQVVVGAERMGTPLHRLPSVELLDRQQNKTGQNVDAELRNNAEKLVSTLQSFGVKTKILDICRGPSVTRYELQPDAGVKISRITNLADDIALNLATAGVRIEAPIPNKAAVGIEVPNKTSSAVSIRSIIESREFKQSASPLTICLGKDIAGKVQIANLAKMPHLLIAGSTGSGKSVCINSIIISFLYKALPEDLKLILIDPKVVELAEYNGIPHLLMPVVTEPRKAAGALGSAVAEMEKRYRLFAENNVRDIKTYNELAKDNSTLEKMPYIAIVIDELADLMMVAGKEVEDYICRIAQKARAAGMHLIVATQRPSVDVITGLIKANIPSRIAFAVSSQIDSRTILDGAGAEKLLGMGDMLFMPVGANKPVRIQGTYVKDDEINRVIKDIKLDAVAEYNEEMIENTEKMASAEKGSSQSGASSDDSDQDPMFKNAVEVVVEANQASTSLLQRRLKLGYARAARIMDEMEQLHIIGPYEGSKPRQVLISRQQFIEMTMNDSQED